jgi:Protein of unknown function (DUF3551)
LPDDFARREIRVDRRWPSGGWIFMSHPRLGHDVDLQRSAGCLAPRKSASLSMPSRLREVPMRVTGSIILAIATVFIAAPSSAQTYDPRYPVCMKLYTGPPGGGEWIDCSFVSIQQCRASASGRPAMCDINPYFVYAETPPGRPHRRPYRPYPYQ